MGKARLEAFSDGVLAIIITIMVLHLEVPHGAAAHDLTPLAPIFLSYVLSFVYVGIYWNNHHHMLQTCKRVTGGILWANLHLLFWLSLFPVTTGWMGAFPSSTLPTALYGVVLLAAAVAYFILQGAIIHSQGEDSSLKKAVGADWKGRASAGLYLASIGLAFVETSLAQALFVVVAALWLIPDRRIERILTQAAN